MLRDITIGQYYPSNSIIHKLDPRTKLGGTFLFIISIFCYTKLWDYILPTVFLGVIIYLSKVPLKFIFKGLKPIVFILSITIIFNIILTPGKVLFHFWIINLTKEGLIMGAKMGLRLILLVIGSAILTFTTTPNQLTDGLEKGLKPLNKIKVPVHEVAMMMSIALRYIPILLDEADKIMKAQIARGADFETGNIIKRAKALVPVLVPLFISAFKRAIDLAMAMEARCYHGGSQRTAYKPLKYKSSDKISYIIIILFTVLSITMGIMKI